MSIITTIIDGLKPNPSSGLGGANEGYIQGFQDDIISGVAGGVADKAGGQCLVTQNSPLGMSVLVTNGVVYVPNSDYVAGLASTTKYYRVVIKDHDPIVIPANTSGDERFDGIDIVLDKDVVPNEYASNVATIVVSAGNSTEPPAVPDNGYRLAEVEVADGATQIVTAAINDVRAQITINDDALPSTTVDTTATQTLTNKTLTSPVINTGVSGTAIPTLVDGTKVYAADAGSTDTYAITLSPAPTAYAAGQVFRFKANTVNTGAATLNVNALGAKTIKKNYNSDLADGDILANQLVEVIYDGTNFQLLSPIANTSSGIITTAQYAPQGFLINGKIVPSVTSNNLTVALKGMDGNDPSASNPVYCRIGDTVRTITAALSVTAGAAGNWFSSGGAEIATKEVDYFVYLGYNATDGVVIGFSPIPFGTTYSTFSASDTARTYCRISTITNAAATDVYENVGRFAATLSAGAGYTWTVPTFTAKNLIQRPIFYTRELSIEPTIYGSGGSIGTFASDRKYFFYKIIGERIFINYNVRITNVGSWSGNVYISAPMPNSTAPGQYAYLPGTIAAQGANATTASKGIPVFLGADNVIYFNSGVATASLQWSGVAANDQILINANYPIG